MRRHTFVDRKARTANKGLASGGSNVSVRQFFVNLGFVARSEFSAENPARTPSPEPLAAMAGQRFAIKHG